MLEKNIAIGVIVILGAIATYYRHKYLQEKNKNKDIVMLRDVFHKLPKAAQKTIPWN